MLIPYHTKSILPSIVVHIAINGTSMLFMALGENAEKSLQNELISDMIRYASSMSKVSSVHVKVS